MRLSLPSSLVVAALTTSGLLAAPPVAGAAPRATASLHHRAPRASGVAAPATTPSSVIEVVVPLHLPAAALHTVQSLIRSHATVAQRRARLDALQPRAPQGQAVRRWAAQHGFTVTASTPWSVDLRGRADALARAFGSSLTTRPLEGKGFVAPRTTPRVPAALAGVADAVVGLDTRPLFRSHDGYGGGDVQVLNSTPVRGSTAGAGTTVASVNLSGWHPDDLTTYRRAAFGTNDTPPLVTSVPVGTGGHAAATVLEDDLGLETEVALDAEAIAGVAPAAQQRMYFGANSSAGYLAVLNQMATDAQTGKFQTASTSWGACELGLSSTTMSQMSDAIGLITAYGSTFFAASGDDGAYGCGDGMTAAVDFPASSPYAVAVGGTSVTGGAASYSSTGWSGSGGGCSQVFAAPAWQVSAGSPCSGRAVPDIATLADPAAGFWVYDHVDEWVPVGGTSLAAPASAAGLADVLSQPHTASVPSFVQTAYAHPGAFDDVQSGSNGLYRAQPGYDLVTGLGSPRWTELEAALFGGTAPAPTGTNEPMLVADPTSDPLQASLVVPVTTGATLHGIVANGEPVDGYAATGMGTAACPAPGTTAPDSVPLAAGPDGLKQVSVAVHTPAGCPSPVSRPVLVDSQSPTVPSLVPSLVGATRPTYRFSWTTQDPAPSTGTLFSYVNLTDLTASRVIVGGFVTTGRTFPYAGQAPLALLPGHLYRMRVDTYDPAYNSGFRAITFRTTYDDRSFSVSSGWRRYSSSPDWMGSHIQSATRGAAVSTRFSGRSFVLGVIKSRYGGYAYVYVDGVRRGTISCYYSKGTLYRQRITLWNSSTYGTHTIVVKVTGSHPSGSYGNTVFLDSFAIG